MELAAVLRRHLVKFVEQLFAHYADDGAVTKVTVAEAEEWRELTRYALRELPLGAELDRCRARPGAARRVRRAECLTCRLGVTSGGTRRAGT